MLKSLIEQECLKEGKFKLKNGSISNQYFDIKSIISNPVLLQKVGDELYRKLEDFDIICGIPYGGLPIACYISTKYNKPMIYIRDKIKEYGTKKQIEGNFKKGDRCVIIDDVLTTGGSISQATEILKDKVEIVDYGVVVNRNTKSDIKSII